MQTDSKIDILDPPEVVAKKIRKAVAAPKIVEGNSLLAFVEYVLLPAAGLRGNREFRVDRDRDGLEPLLYTTIAQMHEDYQNDVVGSIRSLSNACAATLTDSIAVTSIIEGCSVKGFE